MGPALGVDLALDLALDAVVADRRGGVQGVGDLGIGQGQEELRRRGVVRPDAGVAVGLELGPHGPAGGPGPAPGLERAEQVLDVVAVLVGDDVGLGERPTGGPEARAELVEEAEIDVDVPVGRAVERPDGRASPRRTPCPSGR